MRNAGAGLALAYAGALVAGSIGSAARLARPPLVEGAWLLTADFHVHAFPGDGLLPPALLRHEATRRNLHVIALTNHNRMMHARLMPARAGSELPLVLNGQEVTMPEAHVVALGVAARVPWRTGVAAAIDTILTQGGVAILAHPTAEAQSAIGPTALGRLTGVEVSNGWLPQDEPAGLAVYRSVRALGVAAVGSSDFHHAAPLGAQRTFLLVSELSERGVLEALRHGRTAVRVSAGWVGDSTVLEAARSHGSAILDRGTRSGSTAAFLACVVAWLALLGLVLRSRV
jgi:hypothetical protein